MFKRIQSYLVLILLLTGCSSQDYFRQPTPEPAKRQQEQAFPAVHLELPNWIEEEIFNEWGDPRTLILPGEEKQMEFAIWLSRRNVEYETGGPFGAAVFEIGSGQLIAPGVNVVVPGHCSMAHAEFMALAIAQQRVKCFDLAAKHLQGMRLVTSSQPCIQCFGMVHWSGVVEVVYGATARDVEGITGFNEGPLPENWERRLQCRPPLPPVTVRGGVLREKAIEVLRLYMGKRGTVYNAGSG